MYICGTSKSLCAGLRVAFMAFPAAFRPYLAGGTYTINLKTVSLNAAIIAELIHSGLAEEIVAEKIRLAEERGAVYQRVFPESGRRLPPFLNGSPCPPGWTGTGLSRRRAAGGCTCSPPAASPSAHGSRLPSSAWAISSPRDAAAARGGPAHPPDLIEDGGGQAAPLLV